MSKDDSRELVPEVVSGHWEAPAAVCVSCMPPRQERKLLASTCLLVTWPHSPPESCRTAGLPQGHCEACMAELDNSPRHVQQHPKLVTA